MYISFNDVCSYQKSNKKSFSKISIIYFQTSVTSENQRNPSIGRSIIFTVKKKVGSNNI